MIVDKISSKRKVIRKISTKIIDLDNPILKLLFEHGSDGVYVLDNNGYFIQVNPAFEKIVGYSAKEINNSPFKPFIAEEDYDKAFANFVKARDGKTLYYELTLLNREGNKVKVQAQKYPLIVDGKIIGVYGILQAATPSKMVDEWKYYYEKHDSLTKLPNLTSFCQVLTDKMLKVEQTDSILASILIDIDQFELVNQTLGYSVGNQLLMEVANRLSSMKTEYNVAHIGTDQFILLIDKHISSNKDIIQITKYVQKRIKGPYYLAEHEYNLTTNIGIAVYPKDGSGAETLVKHTMLALQEAKKAEDIDSFRFFHEEMTNNSFEKFLLKSKLQHALESQQFVIYYQPRIKVSTYEICGMEALLRWNNPIMGMISPADFIPVAEETGLIVPIGEWVLKTACKQNKEWQEKGFGYNRVSVNVSAKQLLQPNFVDVVSNTLVETGLDGKWLELEITESMLMHNEEKVITVIKQLKELGIKIALDDFGTGYSSLSYLKQFPIDILKIDKSFIDDITDDSGENLISKAMISLGLNLGMEVVAEGVESHSQMAYLKEQNCTEIQGYVFSKPLPIEQFQVLLQKNSSKMSHV